ncbi:hypothetical protein ACFLQ8_03525, partial [Candidatus Auribacterota bacterium]
MCKHNLFIKLFNIAIAGLFLFQQAAFGNTASDTLAPSSNFPKRSEDVRKVDDLRTVKSDTTKTGVKLSDLVAYLVAPDNSDITQLAEAINSNKSIRGILNKSPGNRSYQNDVIRDYISAQFSEENRPIIELIANSIDAVNRGDFPRDVRINLAEDGFTIKDKGSGMDINRILRSLLIPNISDKGTGVDSIGRFGVGFYSALNYLKNEGDTLIVDTSDGKDTYSIVFTNTDGDIRVKLIHKKTKTSKNGTTIKAKLKDFRQVNAEDMITKHVRFNRNSDIYLNRKRINNLKHHKVHTIGDLDLIYSNKKAVGAGKIIIAVNGIVIDQLETLGFHIPQNVVIDFPPTTKLAIGRNKIAISPDAISSLKDLLSYASELDNGPHILSALLPLAKEMDSESELAFRSDTIESHLMTVLRKGMKPRTLYLPDTYDFQDVTINNAVYVHPEFAFISPYMPNEVKYMEVHSDKKVYACKFKDDKQVFALHKDHVMLNKKRLPRSSCEEIILSTLLKTEGASVDFTYKDGGDTKQTRQFSDDRNDLGDVPEFSDAHKTYVYNKLFSLILSDEYFKERAMSSESMSRLRQFIEKLFARLSVGGLKIFDENVFADERRYVIEDLFALAEMVSEKGIENTALYFNELDRFKYTFVADDEDEDGYNKMFSRTLKRILYNKERDCNRLEKLVKYIRYHDGMRYEYSLHLNEIAGIEDIMHYLIMAEAKDEFIRLYAKCVFNIPFCDPGDYSEASSYRFISPVSWRSCKSETIPLYNVDGFLFPGKSDITISDQWDEDDSYTGKSTNVDNAQKFVTEALYDVFRNENPVIVSTCLAMITNLLQERILPTANHVAGFERICLDPEFGIIKIAKTNKNLFNEIILEFHAFDFRSSLYQAYLNLITGKIDDVHILKETKARKSALEYPGDKKISLAMSSLVSEYLSGETERKSEDALIGDLEEISQKEYPSETKNYASRLIQNSVGSQSIKPYVYVRELIQNTRDEAEAKNAPTEDRVLEIDTYRSGYDHLGIVFKDRLGMDLDPLINLLLIPGSSSKRTEKELVGKFGKGFFMIFNEAEWVNIETTSGNGKMYYLTLTPVRNDKGEVIDINIDISIDRKETEPGTKIELVKKSGNPQLESSFLAGFTSIYGEYMDKDTLEIKFRGNRINQDMTLLSHIDTPYGEMKLSLSGKGSVLTHNEIYLNYMDEDIWGLLPKKLREIFSSQPIALNLPAGLDLTQDREEIIDKNKMLKELSPYILTILGEAVMKLFTSGEMQVDLLPYDFLYDHSRYDVPPNISRDIDRILEGVYPDISYYQDESRLGILLANLPFVQIEGKKYSFKKILSILKDKDDQKVTYEDLPKEMAAYLKNELKAQEDSKLSLGRKAEEEAKVKSLSDIVLPSRPDEDFDTYAAFAEMTSRIAELLYREVWEKEDILATYYIDDKSNAHAGKTHVKHIGWNIVAQKDNIEMFSRYLKGDLSNEETAFLFRDIFSILFHEITHLGENTEEWTHNPSFKKKEKKIVRAAYDKSLEIEVILSDIKNKYSGTLLPIDKVAQRMESGLQDQYSFICPFTGVLWEGGKPLSLRDIASWISRRSEGFNKTQN